MKLSPFPCHLVPLRSKYCPQHPILKHPQLAFLPQCQRHVDLSLFSEIWNNISAFIFRAKRSKETLFGVSVPSKRRSLLTRRHDVIFPDTDLFSSTVHITSGTAYRRFRFFRDFEYRIAIREVYLTPTCFFVP